MDSLIDADRAWVTDLEHVFNYGNRVSPRGMLVYETLALQSVISMANPIIYNDKRQLGYKFMAAEAAWILSSRDDVKGIEPYSKEISKFSDDGVGFFGAYGPKIGDQFDYVLSNLMKDLDSRQAVINIWREKPPLSKDIPCTLSLQFLVRHHTLHCVASMRSSDLWLGHPYDIFNFSAVSFALMLQMNNLLVDSGDTPLSLGNLHLTAGSKHIYERNEADVKVVIEDYHLNNPSRKDREPIFVDQLYDDANEFVSSLWDFASTEGGALNLGKSA